MQQLIQTFLERLSTRNLDKLIDLFDDHVDWFIPGNEERASWLGRRTNKNEIKLFFEELWKNTTPISAEVNNILSNENVAIISGEFKTMMHATNKIVDSFFLLN